MRASQVNLLMALSLALGLSGCYGYAVTPPPGAGYGCGYAADPGYGAYGHDGYGYGGYGYGAYGTDGYGYGGYGHGAYGECVDGAGAYPGYGYDRGFPARGGHDRLSLRERLLARRDSRRDSRGDRRDGWQDRRDGRRHGHRRGRHDDIGCDTYFDSGCDDCGSSGMSCGSHCGACGSCGGCDPGPYVAYLMPMSSCCGDSGPCMDCDSCWEGSSCCDSCDTGMIGGLPTSYSSDSTPTQTCAGGSCPYNSVEGSSWDSSPQTFDVPYSHEAYPTDAVPYPVDGGNGERYLAPPAQEGDFRSRPVPEAGGAADPGPQAVNPIQRTLWAPPRN